MEALTEQELLAQALKSIRNVKRIAYNNFPYHPETKAIGHFCGEVEIQILDIAKTLNQPPNTQTKEMEQ